MATILDNIKNLFGGKEEEKQILRKEAPVVYYNSVNTSYQQKTRYDQLSEEGYTENAIVKKCIDLIANNASRVKINLFRGDQEVDEHPLLDLMYSPNPTQGQVEFFASLYSYLLISGNSYILESGAENAPPIELYTLRPDRIRIKGSQTAIPKAYDYMIGGQVANSYQVDPATGNSKVKHIKLFNPLDDYYGLSPIQSAATDIDQHNLANKHNVNLLQNGARPSGAVVFKPKDETGAQIQLSDTQRNQLMTDLTQRFSGTGNAGKPMLLEGDFDWKEMGLSPKDMDFIQLKNMSAKDIALIFGVPSQLIGIPDAQTYSNFAEAKLALYNETIIPLLDRIQSDLNEWLVPRFGDDLEMRYDIDSIPAMAEQRTRVFESVTQGVQNGILTRNEAREQLGYEPIDGGDSLLVPATLMPLNVAGDESQPEVDEDIPEEPKIEDDLENADLSEQKEEITNFPKRGDNKKISLRNSERPQFDYNFAFNVKKDNPKVWRAGGNIRGNEAFNLWTKARDGIETPAVLDWIKERESWAARHFRDGQQFRSGKEPNLSSVAGVVAQMKWGVIGNLGKQGMKDVILEVIKKTEGRKNFDDLIEIEATQEFDEEKQLSARVRDALKKKVDEHNEKYGDKRGKRVTLRMLGAVFRRGVGAYRNNPASVRPGVRSEDQWAYARVNAFLFAVRTGRFQGGKFDLDLLPSGHPLAT
jgi:HK97 family phage portal protein